MTDVAKNYDKAERRKEKLKARVTEIDLIRGICVILMVIAHMFYDLFGVLPFTITRRRRGFGIRRMTFP